MLDPDVGLYEPGLHAVHRDVTFLLKSVQLVSEKQVGKLRLAIRFQSVIGTLEIEVVEIYLSVTV